MIDSHAHMLDERFDEDRSIVINDLAARGISLCIEAGVDKELSYKARELSRAYSNIYAMAGVHPHDAKSAGDDLEDWLCELYGDDKCVAIGEIGLDYHYDLSPREVQQQVFRRQLETAAALGAPVCIHTRDAVEDTYALVREYSDRVTGVIHCFSGSWETAKRYLALGWYISLAGTVTFKNANKLLDVAANTPTDRLLIETDSPYLAPVPLRGRRNDPRNVIHVCSRIAQLKGMDPAALEAACDENTYRLYPKLKRP